MLNYFGETQRYDTYMTTTKIVFVYRPVRLEKNKTQNIRITGFCYSPHKGSVIRKAFPCHDVTICMQCLSHDDVIKWKHFPRCWPFVRGIHRSPMKSPHKGQWRGALMFSLICVWINGWVSNREAGDLRRYRAHYDVIIMRSWWCTLRGNEGNKSGLCRECLTTPPPVYGRLMTVVVIDWPPDKT